MGVYISVLEEGGGLVEEEGRGEKEKRSAKTREDSEEVHQAIASGDKNEEGKKFSLILLLLDVLSTRFLSRSYSDLSQKTRVHSATNRRLCYIIIYRVKTCLKKIYISHLTLLCNRGVYYI